MTTDQRVTETHTEVRVEEVENTRYECAVCELVHDAEAVLTVGLDRQPTESGGPFAVREPEVERIICTHCAEGLFEYSTADGWTPERDGVLPSHFIERIAAYAVVTALVSVPVAGLMAGVASAGVIPTTTAAVYGGLGIAVTMVVGWLIL